MKALVLNNKTQPLVLQDLPDLVPGKEEAIVKIHAAALNHRDLWIQKGMYAGLKYPIVPGSDGSGIVTATGDNTNGHWIGKEVIIYPAMNWGDQPSHQHPKSFKILGLPDDGTFAEYVKVPAVNLFEKPEHLSFEEAAAIPLAGLTAYRALFTRGHLDQNEKLLITGIGGGVALLALQFAIAANVNAYVTSADDEKIARAMALGAKGNANYKNEKWVEQLQEQAGSFDMIFDGAGGDGVGQLLNLTSPGGRIIFYGATRGNPTTVDLRKIFWKQLNILGSTMGTAVDFKSMVDFVNKHKIHPIVDKIFPFSEGENALRRMDDVKQFGKIVLRMMV